MLYILLLVIIFVVADLVARYMLSKYKERKVNKQRLNILNKSLTLDFSHEAKSLKQAKVDNPKARILCVDDEAIILDSFRKILVLDGYSVSTVESGPEAINLIQNHHYDFVFTDLKMPEMDGIMVTKSVREIRPDIDVVIITGYATIESAVECMKYGALDYVQKPFTEDELLEFTNKAMINRQEKINNELKPRIMITQSLEAENAMDEIFAIPGGVFVSPGHCWVGLESDGVIKIGIDDFAKNIIGVIDDIEMPNLGMEIKKGMHLFSVKHAERTTPFRSPVDGKVIKINKELKSDYEQLEITTYHNNWICMIDADNLNSDIQDMMIGKSIVSFYQDEIEKLNNHIKRVAERKNIDLSESGLNILKSNILDENDWREITNTYFA